VRPQPINRAEQAYRRLTEEFLRGRWQPGDTLSTYALAEELEISRTPILEALKRLQAEGLVEIIPQVGCRVVHPSPARVDELFALRGAVEGLAAEGASARISERELRELLLVLRRMEAVTESQDEAKFQELNEQFHRRIILASGMPQVAQVSQGIWSQLQFQLTRLPARPEQMPASLPEHRDIFEALEQGDGKRARAAAEAHALNSSERLLRHLGSEEKPIAVSS
jgi:DNA-binding GntR family transcriptional regulator